MSKPANQHSKPSPSDTPTDRPEDNGGKAVERPEDKEYNEEDVNFGDVSEKREKDEQPVKPIKDPPYEFEDPEKDNPPKR